MAVTIRAGVCVSPFYRHVSAACVRERVQVCVLVSVCAVQYLFPFIGDCGVCGKMSVAHFHTPIVFQWACRCGGYSPWLPGSPHHTWTLLGHGNGWLCGVVCVCLRDRMKVHVVSFLYLLFFSCRISAGNCPALSWPSRRQENSPFRLTGRHISQPPEAHRPSSSPQISICCWMTN